MDLVLEPPARTVVAAPPKVARPVQMAHAFEEYTCHCLLRGIDPVRVIHINNLIQYLKQIEGLL